MKNHFTFDKLSRSLIACGTVDGLRFEAHHVATSPCPYAVCTHPDTTCKLCSIIRHKYMSNLQKSYYERFRRIEYNSQK